MTQSQQEEAEETALQSFFIGPHKFDRRDDAVVFTLPIVRRRSYFVVDPGGAAAAKQRGTDEAPKILPNGTLDEPALAVCIHANHVEGYMHMSRLAWPVVPPMVRAPFANYLPDYMVVNREIWATGFGAVRAAGYWGPDFNFEPTDAFINNVTPHMQ
jgi:hypothetical protein